MSKNVSGSPAVPAGSKSNGKSPANGNQIINGVGNTKGSVSTAKANASTIANSPMSINEAYNVLQVPTNTSDLSLLKQQYQRLAFQCHPDRCNNSNSEEMKQKFHRISLAYAIVKSYKEHGINLTENGKGAAKAAAMASKTGTNGRGVENEGSPPVIPAFMLPWHDEDGLSEEIQELLRHPSKYDLSDMFFRLGPKRFFSFMRYVYKKSIHMSDEHVSRKRKEAQSSNGHLASSSNGKVNVHNAKESMPKNKEGAIHHSSDHKLVVKREGTKKRYMCPDCSQYHESYSESDSEGCDSDSNADRSLDADDEDEGRAHVAPSDSDLDSDEMRRRYSGHDDDDTTGSSCDSCYTDDDDEEEDGGFYFSDSEEDSAADTDLETKFFKYMFEQSMADDYANFDGFWNKMHPNQYDYEEETDEERRERIKKELEERKRKEAKRKLEKEEEKEKRLKERESGKAEAERRRIEKQMEKQRQKEKEKKEMEQRAFMLKKKNQELRFETFKEARRNNQSFVRDAVYKKGVAAEGLEVIYPEVVNTSNGIHFSKSATQETLLHVAVRNDDLPMVEFLVGCGATPDESASNGVNPIHLCCILNRPSILKYYVENYFEFVMLRSKKKFKGCKIDQFPTPLHLACERGHVRCVSILAKSLPKDYRKDCQNIEEWLRKQTQSGNKEQNSLWESMLQVFLQGKKKWSEEYLEEKEREFEKMFTVTASRSGSNSPVSPSVSPSSPSTRSNKKKSKKAAQSVPVESSNDKAEEPIEVEASPILLQEEKASHTPQEQSGDVVDFIRQQELMMEKLKQEKMKKEQEKKPFETAVNRNTFKADYASSKQAKQSSGQTAKKAGKKAAVAPAALQTVHASQSPSVSMNHEFKDLDIVKVQQKLKNDLGLSKKSESSKELLSAAIGDDDDEYKYLVHQMDKFIIGSSEPLSAQAISNAFPQAVTLSAPLSASASIPSGTSRQPQSPWFPSVKRDDGPMSAFSPLPEEETLLGSLNGIPIPAPVNKTVKHPPGLSPKKSAFDMSTSGNPASSLNSPWPAFSNYKRGDPFFGNNMW
ncbi:hypothetical protein MP638_001481 [Amoeboaphelidium occidentale]|nr:hypothetical protein MP638_001481 [Amoeboaphelidium occidentale]